MPETWELGALRLRSHFAGSHSDSNSGAVVTWDLDATNYVLAFCGMRCKTKDAIRYLEFSLHGIYGTPTDSWRVSIQGCDSIYQPDGVIHASAIVDLTGITGDPKTWTIQLDSDYAPGLGQLFCIVIDHSSGSNTAPSSTVGLKLVQRNMEDANNNPPYALYSTDAEATWSQAKGHPIVAYRTATDERFGHYFIGDGSMSVNNGDWYGVSFSLPEEIFGFTHFQLVGGAIMSMFPSADTDSFEAMIIDPVDHSIVQTRDIPHSYSVPDSVGSEVPGFDTVLECDKEYYFVYRHNVGGETLRHTFWEVSAEAEFDTCGYDGDVMTVRVVHGDSAVDGLPGNATWVKHTTKTIPLEFRIAPQNQTGTDISPDPTYAEFHTVEPAIEAPIDIEPAPTYAEFHAPVVSTGIGPSPGFLTPVYAEFHTVVPDTVLDLPAPSPAYAEFHGIPPNVGTATGASPAPTYAEFYTVQPSLLQELAPAPTYAEFHPAPVTISRSLAAPDPAYAEFHAIPTDPSSGVALPVAFAEFRTLGVSLQREAVTPPPPYAEFHAIPPAPSFDFVLDDSAHADFYAITPYTLIISGVPGLGQIRQLPPRARDRRLPPRGRDHLLPPR